MLASEKVLLSDGLGNRSNHVSRNLVLAWHATVYKLIFLSPKCKPPETLFAFSKFRVFSNLKSDMEQGPAHPVKKIANEAQVAQAMWDYYKNHKALFIPAVREYREYILEQMANGRPADQVFAQFMRVEVVVEPATIAPKICEVKKRGSARSRKHVTWPF